MYIQLNSQIICYEKTGEGSPVILIHGNKGDHHTFDALAETMSKDHTVYAMDSRGYGESATPKEYHYADMAADVVNLIKALDIEEPYLLGFSDGAIISLLVAIDHSDLIAGVISCGANLTPDGLKHRDMHDIKKEYKKTQDPKTLMMIQEPNITASQLGKITVPVMVIAGEKDCIKEKETIKISQSIKESSLQILPGEDHASYIVKTDRLYRYIRNFIS